jgi:hypothetical protein
MGGLDILRNPVSADGLSAGELIDLDSIYT